MIYLDKCIEFLTNYYIIGYIHNEPKSLIYNQLGTIKSVKEKNFTWTYQLLSTLINTSKLTIKEYAYVQI